MGINNKYPFALKGMECLHRCSGYVKLTTLFLWLVGMYSLMRETKFQENMLSDERIYPIKGVSEKRHWGDDA